MKKIKLSAVIVACAMIPGVALAAKNVDGEKIDLTAIDAAITALTERVTALETELTEKQITGDFVATHSGIYDVFIVDMTAYGCGNTTDFASLATFAERLAYFSNQAISSVGYRTARTTATSDGFDLLITPYDVTEIETRLSGKAENLNNVPGDVPNFKISGNGNIGFSENGTFIDLGSMSADGTMFQILGTFAGDDDGCEETSATYIVGHRI